MVLYERVGLENVGTNLAAPFDFLHFALDFGHLFFLFALAQLQELGFEHAHADFPVLNLDVYKRQVCTRVIARMRASSSRG